MIGNTISHYKIIERIEASLISTATVNKVICILLIICLLHSLLGCSGMTSTITRRDDIGIYLEKREKLTIMTKDSDSYFFNTNTYKVIGDSLSGKGQRIVQGKKDNPESIKIAVNDIIQIKYTAEDNTGTLFIILLSLGLVVGIIYLAVSYEMTPVSL